MLKLMIYIRGSLRTLLPHDEASNAKVGKDICLYECKNSVVHAANESKDVVLGLDGYKKVALKIGY